MNGLSVAGSPAMGLIGAVGVLLVFIGWNAVRAAGPRTRAVAAAVGVTTFAVALSGAIGNIMAFAALVAMRAEPSSEAAAAFRKSSVDYLLLGLGGVVVTVLVVWGIRRLVAPADSEPAPGTEPPVTEPPVAEPADDADGTPVPAPPDAAPGRRTAAWTDVAALALALALPVPVRSGSVQSYDEPTLAVVLYLVVAGVVLAAPLLVTAARADLRDRRLVAAAFAVVATGAVVAPLAPAAAEHVAWFSLGSGLTFGLLASSLALLSGALSGRRGAVAVGAVIGLVIVLLGAVLATRVAERAAPRELAAPSAYGGAT